MKDELLEAYNFIRNYINQTPRIGIILGSGLGSFADHIDNRVAIPSELIPAYPVSTVEGHKGYLVFGSLNSIPILAVQGRTHYYEGYSIKRVTFIIRVMARIGIRILIVTNAAGGINPTFVPGDFMLITDHISKMFCNPLIGTVKYQDLRSSDMLDPYASKYHCLVEQAAMENNIPLRRGILLAIPGPSYETAAEVKMIARMGADASSMSTVPEVIMANHLGLDVIGISCITNMATGISKRPLSHSEVTETANCVSVNFLRLLTEIINKLKSLFFLF
jgi:purine-nucleoside phosphorylase